MVCSTHIVSDLVCYWGLLGSLPSLRLFCDFSNAAWTSFSVLDYDQFLFKSWPVLKIMMVALCSLLSVAALQIFLPNLALHLAVCIFFCSEYLEYFYKTALPAFFAHYPRKWRWSQSREENRWHSVLANRFFFSSSQLPSLCKFYHCFSLLTGSTGWVSKAVLFLLGSNFLENLSCLTSHNLLIFCTWSSLLHRADENNISFSSVLVYWL